MFNKQSIEDKKDQDIQNRFKEQKDAIQNILETVANNNKATQDSLKEIRDENASLRRYIQILLDSDKDDIRAWITQEHHYYMTVGSIDDYTLDCLERRFKHYQEEGGNSYVEGLMKDLRGLRKQPFYPPIDTVNRHREEIKGE